MSGNSAAGPSYDAKWRPRLPESTTTLADILTTADLSDFRTPGRGHGILDIFTKRYLLKVLVKKDVSTRYRNSVFGWLWSYAKPGAQFLVYYLVMGHILGLNRGKIGRAHV